MRRMELGQGGLIYKVESLNLEGRLKDISLEVRRSEKIVLLGVNGAGKSSLLKVLAGLSMGYEGNVSFKDADLRAILRDKELKRSFRRSVAIMLQEVSAMFFNPTVYDEIAFSLRQLGFPEKEVEQRVYELSERLGIDHLLRREPYNLSGGEKKKVAFACCIIHEPEVLLLDEPTAHMDPEGTGVLIDLLYELHATTVVATHNLSISRELGDRFLLLSKDHRLVYDGVFGEDMKERLKEAGFLHRHGGKDPHAHDWD